VVTIFDSLYDDKPVYSEANDVLSAFAVRGKHYSTIERIRNSKEKAERDELKKTLPIVCFGGRFTARKKAALEKASQLIILDFDEGENLKTVRERMEKWNCTYSCFSSPSGGDRFKALVKIDEVKDDEEFKEYFDFFERNYSVDISGKDISRACFSTYDPDIYINANAKVFTKEMLKRFTPKPPRKQTDQKLIELVSNWIRLAPQGTRQHNCCKAGFYAGGLTKMGQLEQSSALAALHQAAQDRGGEIDQSIRAINESFEQGKLRPILNINELDNVVRGMKKKVVDVKSLIVSPDKMNQQSEDLYEGRLEMGRGIGIANFDKFVRFRQNSFTFIVGKRGVGKTATTLYLLCLDAKKSDTKYLVCGIENSSFSLRNQLISFYLRERAAEAYKTNKIGLRAAEEFIDSHFVFIQYDEAWEIADILSIAKQLDEEHNFGGLFIDPYNAVTVPNVPNTFKYHVDSANACRMFSDRHFSVLLTAHPNSAGQREAGTPSDVMAEHGGTFPNKAHMTMVVDRNAKAEGEEKYTTRVSVDKVRDKDIFGGDETATEFPIVMRLNPINATFIAHLPIHGESNYEFKTYDLMSEVKK
jgi:hypothetical protein